MNDHVKCCRCRFKHWEADRLAVPDLKLGKGASVLICPRCGAQSYFIISASAEALTPTPAGADAPASQPNQRKTVSTATVRIHLENRAMMAETLKRERRNRVMRRDACLVALPALERLAIVMQGRSGQPYKLRQLLFSLWNGKPASLVEITGLDWEIRQDLALLFLAYGYEEHDAACFYDAIQSAVTKAGQWEWFLEERHNVEQMAEYVRAAKEAANEH